MPFVNFYIANEAEAETVATTEDNSQWPNFWTKGMGPVEFMELWAILRGVDFDPDLDPEGPILYQADDEGPWVLRFKAEFVEDLARLQTDEIDKLAEAWIQQSEFLAEARASDIAQFLRQLVNFAVQSRSSKIPILTMWVL